MATRTRNLSPGEEADLLRKINTDVHNGMNDLLYEYGLIFGARDYDGISIEKKNEMCDKIMMGLYGGRSAYNPYPVPFKEPETPFVTDEARQDAIADHKRNEEERIAREKKQKKIDDANFEKAGEILDIVLKERDQSLSTLYMNFVLVLFVQADVKSSVQDIGAVKMFRFSKNGKDDHSWNNLYIGGDMRLYKNWAGFVENHKIPHNSLVLAPSRGEFTFRNGTLDLDMFYVEKYCDTFVEPVCAIGGLIGTGMLCICAAPVAIAAGMTLAGVGAVTGIIRAIEEYKDRREHGTLTWKRTALIILDILSNTLFVHSALCALKLTGFVKTFLTSERFLSCVLFAENALRIGALSRLSLDVVRTIIAYGLGELNVIDMTQRILASCIFLYNVGIPETFMNNQMNITALLTLLPSFLSYDRIQPYVQLARNYFEQLPAFSMVGSLEELTGLICTVIHNTLNRNGLNFRYVICALRRLMNSKWNAILEDLKRCKDYVVAYFTPDEYISNFTNIQLAIVYNIRETLKKSVHCDDINIAQVDFYINRIMKEIIRVWKRMVAILYPDDENENPDILHFTKVMRYLLNKIHLLVRHEVESSSTAICAPNSSTAICAPNTSTAICAPNSSTAISAPDRRTDNYKLPVEDMYGLIMSELAMKTDDDFHDMCSECADMIARDTLKPIKNVATHRYASVSFIQQQPNDEATDQVIEEDGAPTAYFKVDPATRLGVLIKYTG